ncbi:MAG TPA: hypothetical protein VGJ60_04265, partial [Chloroflexota bacterium]
EPSLQLVGRSGGVNVDLPTLAAAGVSLTGRLMSIDGAVVSFADDLQVTLTNANRRLERVLGRIDAYIAAHGLNTRAQSHEHFLWTTTAATLPQLDLHRAGVSTVIWATGYRRSYPWLYIPAAWTGTVSSITAMASHGCLDCTCSANASSVRAAPTSSEVWVPTLSPSPVTCSTNSGV